MKDSNVNPAVWAAVKKLAQHEHIDLYIATVQEHYRAAYLWKELGFRHYFRKIFYSARLGHLKDSPEFFHTINVELGIAPGEQPLFFDDHPSVVRSACEAGWEACVFDAADDVIGHPRLQGLL